MSAPLHETRWSVVTRATGDSPEARAALSELCEIYYPPVYRFILRWKGRDDAEDLTQEFFARLIEKHTLDRVDPARGRFRNFLFAAVKHFLLETRTKELRLKRGGDRKRVVVEPDEFADHDEASPDLAFDRSWACALLDRALCRLAAEWEEKGKTETFEALRPWMAGTSEHGEQLAVAERLGISETAVRVILHRMRLRLRQIVEGEIAQTLEPGDNPVDELRHLLGIW